MNMQTYNDIKKYLCGIIKGTEFENNVFAVGGCVRDMLMNKPIKDKREFCFRCKTMDRYQEVIIVANAVRAAVHSQWEIQPDMIDYKLPITGDDIMEILNIGPCKKIKDVQNALM